MLARLLFLACLLGSTAASAQTSQLNAATQSPQPMPFVRAVRSPFVLPVTATPQQFIITQPADTRTYRAFNPCVAADVRLMTVSPLEPVVTQPTAYPGVLKVTSKTEVIDRISGMRYGRGPETLGSSRNPIAGQDRIISTMLVPIPGYTATGDISNLTCEVEMHYGNSS